MIVSSHAVERYQERVRPGLDLAGARRELEGVLSCGRFGGPPPWKTTEGESGNHWYWLGDDIVLLVCGSIAVTVLVRDAAPSFIAGRRFGKRVVRGAKRARSRPEGITNKRARKAMGWRRDDVPEAEAEDVA